MPQFRLTKRPNRLWLIQTALLLLCSCESVQIKNFQACSPFPGALGAACDDFLVHNPKTLTEEEWEALQISWMAKGDAIECIPSSALGDLKSEIEKLCSKTDCDQEAQQMVIQGLARLMAIKKGLK